MQLILPLIIIMLVFMVETGYAEGKFNVRGMAYGDSDDVSIWEGLILYETVLDNHDELSLEYGYDSVTSASFSTSSGPSATLIEGEEEEEGEHGEGESKVTKGRHSGSVNFKHYFTSDIYGTSSLQLSTKSDYTSGTLGQTISFPFPNRDTILGFGAYYTANYNEPEVNTTNAFLIPEEDNLDSNQITSIISIEHLINQKSRIKFLTEHFVSSGYLSTGYQFVPIKTGPPTNEALEQLPDSRTGTAFSIVYSRWLFDASAIHWRLRLYNDDFGITAQSTDMTRLTYLNDNMILDLKYRYYQQTKADFWANKFPTVPAGNFTNHPALEDFVSHQFSLGLRYELESGNVIKPSLDHYLSDTGFSFTTISVGYEFEL